MKKFKKVNNNFKKTVEAYHDSCFGSCDCGCNPFYGYPAEIGIVNISSVYRNNLNTGKVL